MATETKFTNCMYAAICRNTHAGVGKLVVCDQPMKP